MQALRLCWQTPEKELTLDKLKEGWTRGEWLKESNRFDSLILIGPDGTRYFAKAISYKARTEDHPMLLARFQNEVAFNREYRGRLPFALREITEVHKNGFVGTLFPGEALLKLAHTNHRNLLPHITTVADVAIGLIQQEIPEEVRTEPVDIAQSVIDARWLPGAIELLGPGELDKAMAAIMQHQDSVTRGLTHGDLTWEHIFKLPDGQLALIALDGAGTERPRLYDVAYDYTRIVTYSAGSWDMGKHFLRRIQGKLGLSLDEFVTELRAPLIERSLGTLYDAKMDYESETGEGRDYRHIARELHKRTMEGGIFTSLA